LYRSVAETRRCARGPLVAIRHRHKEMMMFNAEIRTLVVEVFGLLGIVAALAQLG
jgi:hypothetical protein